MGSWNGTVPSHAAGATSRADKLQTLDDIATALTASWTDYSSSFVIGASTTPPTKGAGTTYSAFYRRLGHTLDYNFSITIGAGWSSGSGTYRFPLPVAAVAPKTHVGRVYVQDSGTAFLTGLALFDSTSDTWLSILLANSTGALMGSGGPGTAWNTGDKIQCSITLTV